MRLVVDASVAIKWFLPEPHAEQAAALLLGAHDLLAPDLLLIELANVFWKRRRRGEVTAQDADAALRRVSSGVLDLAPSTVLLPLARTLADNLSHPVYDMLYLAMAVSEDAIVATADRRFLHAVTASPHAGRARWIGDVEG